jgi:hypothetical protein
MDWDSLLSIKELSLKLGLRGSADYELDELKAPKAPSVQVLPMRTLGRLLQVPSHRNEEHRFIACHVALVMSPKGIGQSTKRIPARKDELLQKRPYSFPQLISCRTKLWPVH